MSITTPAVPSAAHHVHRQAVRLRLVEHLVQQRLARAPRGNDGEHGRAEVTGGADIAAHLDIDRGQQATLLPGRGLVAAGEGTAGRGRRGGRPDQRHHAADEADEEKHQHEQGGGQSGAVPAVDEQEPA
ncbi:hypothetical protein [Carbonactinospora thermoautotrophica]|uniref:hypothetical protein n=1 Tax=Carbonactinospora thermoautotrophica TaxID=1469144 RepID=UPI003DA8F2B3